MRIQKSPGPGLPIPIEGESRPVPLSPALAEQHDSTLVSEIARVVAAARVHVDSSSDIRELRVRAVKKSIQNGSYSADPEEIARKLLDHGI